MRTKLFALLILALPLVASAQTSPVGRWKTIDDETGKVMTITEVYQAKNGTLAARIVEAVNPAAAKCDECSGKQKGQSTIGMNVLWNLKPTKGGWGEGQGFKPSTGDSFKAKSVKLVDGGRKLEVTGCKMMFCRSATWQRAD
jgi:uncharacterized protein (DUF2147 family)